MTRPDDGAGRFSSFLICALALLCGAVAGVVSAGMVEEPSAVSSALGALLTAGDGGFFRRVLIAAEFPAAVFCLSFFLFGAPLIPAVCLVRGFLLAFSAAVAAGTYGSFPVNAAAFGTGCLITVPALLMLAPPALDASAALFAAATGRRSGRAIYTGAYFRCCGLCAAAVLCAAALDTFVVPALLTKLLNSG